MTRIRTFEWLPMFDRSSDKKVWSIHNHSHAHTYICIHTHSHTLTHTHTQTQSPSPSRTHTNTHTTHTHSDMHSHTHTSYLSFSSMSMSRAISVCACCINGFRDLMIFMATSHRNSCKTVKSVSLIIWINYYRYKIKHSKILQMYDIQKFISRISFDLVFCRKYIPDRTHIRLDQMNPNINENSKILK